MMLDTRTIKQYALAQPAVGIASLSLATELVARIVNALCNSIIFTPKVVQEYLVQLEVQQFFPLIASLIFPSGYQNHVLLLPCFWYDSQQRYQEKLPDANRLACPQLSKIQVVFHLVLTSYLPFLWNKEIRNLPARKTITQNQNLNLKRQATELTL